MKLFKKIFVAIVASAMLFGCSTSNKVPTDEDFIVNVGKVLETRWKEDKDESTMSTSEIQSYYKSCVQSELSAIGNIDDYEFENEDLKELGKKYIDALNLQMDGVQYVGTDDYEKYEKTWYRGYCYRALYLKQFVDDYGLTVKPEKQTRLDDILAEYAVAKESIDNYEFATYLEDNLAYNKDESKSDEWTAYYTAIVENTTDHEIASISINANFIDASGVTVYNSYSYINNIKPGAKAESELYYDVEKGDFDHIELTVEIY